MAMKGVSGSNTIVTATTTISVPVEIPARIGNSNSLTNSSNQSSHSPSVTGELLDVKVEITPAPPTPMSDIQNSFSLESTSSLTICSDSSKSQSMSPNTRKFSEIPIESGGFLSPMGNFNRMNPSPPASASARLFKKLEEMIDLSLPYNHYRHLSPSETNLTNTSLNDRPHSVSPNARQLDAGKPGSSRLLRRQFSLDKDDMANQASKLANLETISSLVDSTKLQSYSSKAQYQPLISSSSLPASSINLPGSGKLHKHQSASVAQDLEKIEEINLDNSNNSPISHNVSNSTSSDVNSFKNSNNSVGNLKTPTTTTASISNNGGNAERGDFCINVESLGFR
jgi:guanylate cyclase 2F